MVTLSLNALFPISLSPCLSDFQGITIENWTKSFAGGLPLAAIINKYRPTLLDYKALDHKDAEGCLRKIFIAAEKYFGLEQYLQPTDFQHLDPKSMFLYVSEYYNGVQQQRKVDLAARRINKLIAFTQDNDAMKAEYDAGAQRLKGKRVGFLGFALFVC